MTADSAVALTVSSGPATTDVPNVVGDTQAAASTAITGAGLTVGTVSMSSSATVASGEVISESPAAGASVAAGTAVALTVSSGGGVGGSCASSSPTQAVWTVAGISQNYTATSVPISEYCIAQLTAGGSITPLETLNVPTTGNVQDAAFDAGGNLWVLKLDAAANNSIAESIIEYSAAELAGLHSNSAPAPVVTLTNPVLSNSVNTGVGIAFDKSGNLWASTNNGIYEFSTAQLAVGGSQTPVVSLTPTGLVAMSRLTFDGEGNLWVIDANLETNTPSIHELSQNSIGVSGSPSPVISLSVPTLSYYTTGNSNVACPWNDLAFDGSGNLWGVESGYSFEFASAQLNSAGASPTTFIDIIGDPVYGPITGPASSLAFDANNDLFTAVNSDVGGGTSYGFETLTPAQYMASPPTGTANPSIGNSPGVGAILVGPFVP